MGEPAERSTLLPSPERQKQVHRRCTDRPDRWLRLGRLAHIIGWRIQLYCIRKSPISPHHPKPMARNIENAGCEVLFSMCLLRGSIILYARKPLTLFPRRVSDRDPRNLKGASIDILWLPGKAGSSLVHIDPANGTINMDCISQLPIYVKKGSCPEGSSRMPDGSCPFGSIVDKYSPDGPSIHGIPSG